jgi:hypothetical protein
MILIGLLWVPFKWNEYRFNLDSKMKKNNFILLEVLISFILLSVCIVPLITHPLKLYRYELRKLEKMEKERLADWTFSEIKEKLLKNEIPWKKIPSKGEKSEPFQLENGRIDIPSCKTRLISRKFVLETKGEKEGKNGEDYRLLSLLIYLDENQYEFSLSVKKI